MIVSDPFFQMVYLFILAAAFAISGTFRYRARQQETIPRTAEDQKLIGMRLMSLPFFLALLSYGVQPRWMAWSSFPIATEIRLVAAGISFICLGLLYWLFQAIGSNISETVLTKKSHQLIQSGPYQYVRHPLYGVGILLFTMLAIIAANWFILLFPLLAFFFIYIVVIPREEAALVEKFGAAYKEYQQTTGKVWPRWGK